MSGSGSPGGTTGQEEQGFYLLNDRRRQRLVPSRAICRISGAGSRASRRSYCRCAAIALEKICQALAHEATAKYNFLADLTAVDWGEREPRYDVVYHLLSLQTRAVLRLKVGVGGEDAPDPEVPTVTSVWAGANFYEREVFDLFGIRFIGHPNMTRILMPSDG